MKLKELCSRTGLKRRTVHFYIDAGLVAPGEDAKNGYFDFSESHAEQFIFIRELRKAGISLKDIRSIMVSPITTGYYLNLHMEKMRKDIRHMEQTIHSLRYVLETIPVDPGFGDVFRAVNDAGFPLPPEKSSETGSERFDVHLINHFLWHVFLPREALSEYHAFLWHKLDLLAAKDPAGNYKKIGDFLRTLNHGEIDLLYTKKSLHIHTVSETEPENFSAYSMKQIEKLRIFLNDTALTNAWNSEYEAYHLPYLMIGTSPDEERILTELSPVFARYLENITRANAQTYAFLHSTDGKPLLDRMNSILGNHLDLETGNHAQIEYICSLTC